MVMATDGSPGEQKEEQLLAKVAIQHKMEDGYQLLQSPNWQTLMAILRESGENAPVKRAFVGDSPLVSGSEVARNAVGEDITARGINDGPLAKRFRGFSLKD